MVGPPSGPRNNFTSNYRVLAKEKGNVKVIEYGILFSTYYGEEIYNNAYYLIKEPTLQTNGPHIITKEFGVGEKVMRRKGYLFLQQMKKLPLLSRFIIPPGLILSK
ncbi:MAG TPA: hypothetical protein VGN64_12135 [Dyadobacter sp.]|jgi:hypothetical protein|nr:hypothetical protein [Dyadobacter sp.]